MIAYLPLLVALIGLLLYGLSEGSPKLAAVGRLAFACGLLVTLLTAGAGQAHGEAVAVRASIYTCLAFVGLALLVVWWGWLR